MYDAREEENVSVQAFQQIYVAPIDDRLGTLLRTELRRALGENAKSNQKLYTLNVQVKEGTVGLGVQKDATATRANLIVSAQASLFDQEDQTLFSVDVSSRNSYNLLTETYATVEARNDAQRRGVRELAQQIRSHLAVYFLRRTQDDGQNQSRSR